MLAKYGVLSNNNISATFTDLIKQNNFIINEDYQLLNVQELRSFLALLEKLR